MPEDHSTPFPPPADRQVTTISADRSLVVIQRNPTSGSGRGRKHLRNLMLSLQEQGFETRIYQNRDRFTRFVSHPQHAERIRCLVAAGGDGTISSLVQRHPNLPVATLPLGTENLVAKHLGLTCDGNRLAKTIADGCCLSFDVGLAGSHPFLLMASLGLDAEVVHQLAGSRTGNISHFSYLKPIASSFCSYSYPELSVHNREGQLLAIGSHVLVSNMPEYGMKIPFAPDSDPHDGLLDVRVFQKTGMLASGWHLLKTRLGFTTQDADVTRFRESFLTVKTTNAGVPIQADGDPCGHGEVSFQVAKAKMKLIVPIDFNPRTKHPATVSDATLS